MLLFDLLREAGYAVPHGLENTEILGICDHCNEVREGYLFVAIRGLHDDGNNFLGKALHKGARFVVSERELFGVAAMVVENAREALARLTDAFWGHPSRDLIMIGVTGTNGKTSVCELVFSALRANRISAGIIGTIGCRINEEPPFFANMNALSNMTTPEPGMLYPCLAKMRARGVRCVVMEVTSHALAFDRVAPIFFDCAAFTNLSQDHLDLHGDMESYFLEKQKLFLQAKSAVILQKDEYGERLAGLCDMPMIGLRFGENLTEVQKMGQDGVSFCIDVGEGKQKLFLPIPGDFAVENGAVAAAICKMIGMDIASIQKAFTNFCGVKGRMERVLGAGKENAVYIDYAHTPDALEKLLRCVREFAPKARIVLLFGCGGDRDRQKRPLMGRIASALADLLIITSDNCRSEDPNAIIADILRGVDKTKPYLVIPQRKEAIARAVSMLKKGDILILAGKGHECYEISGGARLPFDERALLEENFRKKNEGGYAD